ncbi:MAG: polysaccharide pyruvyl transferase family protein [Bacteroidales bacterium]|nr:polysaccharide pyruvyl transferase family protein [Bacteroidales bacterium]
MRVGIVTLPFHYNFGGILQAYALQNAIKKIGCDTVVMTLPCKSIKDFIKKTLYSLSKNYRFVTRNINCVKSESPFSKDDLDKYEIDVLIVGSDQVWRPSMGEDRVYNVNRYFLKTNNNRGVKKIAYAASFGVDYWDFTDSETVIARELVKDFHSISVRENTGITLYHKYLGNKNVKCVLDPTLLFDSFFYKRIIGGIPYKTNKKHSFVYLLDHNNEKKINVLNNMLPVDSEIIFSKVEKNVLKRYFSRSIGVEDWLASIYYCDIFITDSFHGCVFSILFHKNFYVMSNEKAGNARIQMLLNIFGLEGRMVSDDKINHSKQQIDWKKIDEKIDAMRVDSLQFIKDSLEL